LSLQVSDAFPRDYNGARMALTSGTKLGPYEIVAPLGAGGMGEVYRARDTRLDRTIAIKVLASHLSSSPELKQRFEREAKSISALNHPHICHLYDVGSQDGIDYLVMEFLEGETLAERLRQGALPLKETLKVGIEVSEALEVAHRAGITHRDLKPGNIMLTKSGAKLMDFGLAKATAAGLAAGVANAPLLSAARTTSGPSPMSPLTSVGEVIGTIQYMSPEQIEGKKADARSDLFALGAVLYEMATGKRAFAGKSQISVASAILEKDPEPISATQPLTPPAFEHVVLRCLIKDPDERWQTARDLAGELKWIAEGVRLTKAPEPVPRHRERLAWGLAALCIALLIWLGFTQLRSTRSPERQHLRLSLLPPQSTSFVPYNFAISPDGRRLAFAAAAQDGGTALWIRSLAAGTAQQLTGTEGAMYPFWSPDNRQVGFFGGGKLKSVDPSGSAVQIICDAPGGAGGTWNDHGTIVFAVLNRSSGSAPGLMKVSASGGEPQPATKINASNAAMLWPSFLPDGDHFLYFISMTTDSGPNKGIYLGSLNSMDSKMISSEVAGNTQFASRRFFYVRDGSLMAQPFDLERLQTTGPPEPVAQQELEQNPALSRAGFSVSDNGVVVLQSASDSVSRLSWFDRAGKELDELPTTGYRDPALSRDGTLLAVSSDDERNGKRYIHIYDFARGTSTRVSDGGTEVFPVLSPDGRSVAYVGNDGKGSPHIYAVATDGSGKPERLVESNGAIPNDWSPDGRYLVYMNFQNGPTELDFYEFRKHSHSVYASGDEAQFSPDGKWVAFSGPRSTSYQDSDVVVAQFPGPGGRIQISNQGGAQARWRADGKELFYISADKKLMAVSIDTSHGKLVAGVPHALFQTRIIAPRIVLFQYAVSPDGKRFLINSLPSVGATPLTVLMN
jgi:serine/threonine protein kinase/Tol biopolymer transport system component